MTARRPPAERANRGRKPRPDPKREDMPTEQVTPLPTGEIVLTKNKSGPVIANVRPDLGPAKTGPVRYRKDRPKYDGNKNVLATPENRKAALELFATGATWRQVCGYLGCTQSKLQQWLIRDPEFMEDYRAAKDISADFLLDQVREIASDLSDESQMVWVSDDEHPNGGYWEHPNYERLKALATTQRTSMEALRMTIEKRASKRFGALVKLGGDENNPIQVVVTDYANATFEKPERDINVIEHEVAHISQEGRDDEGQAA